MKIKTLEGLNRAALQRRSVFIPKIGLHMSAAFVIGIPAKVVLGYFGMGMEIYPKPSKRAAKGAT